MVMERFKKWLGRKTMPSEPGITDPAAGVRITRDMLAAVQEAKKLLVSAKEGEPIYKRERNMLQTINEMSLQATKGENSFLQQINNASVHKAAWYSSILQVSREMEQHISLTEQLLAKISEFKEAYAAEQYAKQTGVVTPEIEKTRAEAMKAFSSLFVEVQTLKNEFDEFRTKASAVLNDIEIQRKTALKLKENMEFQAKTAENLAKTIEQSWNSYQAMTARMAATQKKMTTALAEARYLVKTYAKKAA